MGRTVYAGTVVRDQLDVYQPIGSFKRVQGLQSTSFALTLFVDNLLLQWAVQDGTSVADSAVAAGTVYVNEIVGSPGFYAVRFYPDRVGFWKLVHSVPVYGMEIVKEYDAVPAQSGPASPNSLNASFMG